MKFVQLTPSRYKSEDDRFTITVNTEDVSLYDLSQTAGYLTPDKFWNLEEAISEACQRVARASKTSSLTLKQFKEQQNNE